MLKLVTLEGIKLPKLYIAENVADAKLAMENGLPFVRWTLGVDNLIKMLLRPTLEKMFPGIIWGKVLGEYRYEKTDVILVDGSTMDEVDMNIDGFDNAGILAAQYDYDDHLDMDKYRSYEKASNEKANIAKSRREFANDISNEATFEKRTDIRDYVGDLSANVNLDVLQKLNLLPTFVGDIVDCIKINLSNNMRWTEGYNKKLKAPVGRFGVGGILPNLIILDVSASIPRGISATMLTLIDTMRTQLNAELIITSNRSVYYAHEDKLPSPQTLRNYFGCGNEAAEFYAILNEYIAGRGWGHVISFGDYDTPANFSKDNEKLDLKGTKVHAVHHYHTGKWHLSTNNSKTYRTGYAEWCHTLGDESMEEYQDQSWCNIMKN